MSSVRPISIPGQLSSHRKGTGLQSNQRLSLIWLLKEREQQTRLSGSGQCCGCVAVGMGLQREVGEDHAYTEPAPLLHRTCSASTHQAAGATGTPRTLPHLPCRPRSPQPSQSEAASMSTAGPRRLCEGGHAIKIHSVVLLLLRPAGLTLCLLARLSTPPRRCRLRASLTRASKLGAEVPRPGGL